MGVAILCSTVALLVLGFAPESVASVHSNGRGDHRHQGHPGSGQRGFDAIDLLVWGGFSEEDHQGDDRFNSEFRHVPSFAVGGDEHESDDTWDTEDDCRCSLLRFLDRGGFLLNSDTFRFEVEHAVREKHHDGKWNHHRHFAGHFIERWMKGHGDREDCDDDPPAVPEPSTALLIGLGLLGIGFGRGRSRRG